MSALSVLSGSHMNEQQLKQIESELGLKLPAQYVKIVRNFPEELKHWPKRPNAQAYDRRNDFLLEPTKLLKANQAARRKLRKDFPAAGFVIGGDRTKWLIDTKAKNPRVDLIHSQGYIVTGMPNLQSLYDAVVGNHKEAWAKAKKLEKSPGKATLSAESLIAEGRRMAIPAVALAPEGSKYAAVWRGTGVVPAGKGEWQHWISIDTSFLPENPRKLTGVVSLYEWWADDDRIGELKVVHDAKAKLPRKTDGERLYARPFQCMPDVDVVFRFGSKPIQEWLKANSWDPKAGYSDHFPDMKPVKAYLGVVRSEHPFASGDGSYAMLGGWSWCFTWCYPEGKYDWSLSKKALIVLTIQDAEPWIEVYDDGKKFQAFSRVT